jgi:hypothetical protein
MSAGAPVFGGGKNGSHSVAMVGAAGGSFAVVLAAMLAKPELAFGLARSFGPVFVVTIAVLYVMDRWFSRGIEAFRENTEVQRQGAAANESLAGAVRQIAERDDKEAEITRREIRYIGGQTEKLMERLDDVQRSIDRGKGAHA